MVKTAAKQECTAEGPGFESRLVQIYLSWAFWDAFCASQDQFGAFWVLGLGSDAPGAPVEGQTEAARPPPGYLYNVYVRYLGNSGSARRLGLENPRCGASRRRKSLKMLAPKPPDVENARKCWLRSLLTSKSARKCSLRNLQTSKMRRKCSLRSLLTSKIARKCSLRSHGVERAVGQEVEE